VNRCALLCTNHGAGEEIVHVHDDFVTRRGVQWDTVLSCGLFDLESILELRIACRILSSEQSKSKLERIVDVAA